MRHLVLENLERRELLTINLSTTAWTPVGPAPINGGAFSQPTTPGNNPVAGRITAIAASASDPNLIYIGGADGGVWKTTDGGTTWTPLTDNQKTLAIGSLAIAPSNSSIIYAGTGETNNSGDSQYGRGVLKSTDGGQTWSLLGTFQFDRRAISKIIVDPTNPNTVYASVTAFAVNGLPGNTGVWKSADGGITWVNTTSSISTSFSYNDMVMDPTNPQTLYVGASNPFGLDPASGVYKTTNGGGSWTLVGSSLPSGASLGRIALAISKSNPQELVVAIVDPILFSAKLYKTLDGGANWSAIAGVPNFTGFQGWYDVNVGIDPSNANILYASGAAGSNSFIESLNGGTNWTDISQGQNGSGPHVDHHALTFDASGRVLDGDDGGIFRLDNNTAGSIAWSDLNGNLQITQFYSVSLHPSNPNIAFGGTQDNGVVKFSGTLGWTESDGGDGGVTIVDPFNPNTVYHAFPTASFFGFIQRSDDGGQTWQTKISGINSNDPMNFIQPFVLDTANAGRLLFGTNRVYETTNHGDVWTPISAPNQNGWTSNAPIDAIAISKSNPNTIYATAGGDIFVTANDGASWKQIDIPAVNDHFAALAVDPNSSLTAYAVHDQFGGQEIFRTTDGGNTWRDISGNLPAAPANSIVLDGRPNSRAIYVGTDTGVYVSTNNGGSWVPFHTGLPNVQVLSLALNTNLNILAAGTHGRGMFETLIADIIQAKLTPPQVQEGQALTNAPVATFTDSAAADPVGNYLATIDWGDGSPTTTGVVQANSDGTFSVLGSHTYAEEGTYNMTVSISDTDGASNKVTGPIKVDDAPLHAVASGVQITSQEGASIGNTLLASFTDENPNAPASDYSATIDWGDGQVTIGTIVANMSGGYDVFGSHTFAEGGQQLPIKVTINDVGGASATVTDTAVVTDFPLTAQGTSVNLVEGSTTSSVVAKFTDADPDNPSPNEYTITIDWGDGTTTGGSVVNDPNGGFDVIGAHGYDEGSYTINVTIVDAGGSTATATSSATVTDAPIAVAGVSGVITALEGIQFSGIIGTITDQNPLASASDFTITIDWGDSSTSQGTAVAQGNGLFQITASHTFSQVKSYNITISVTDKGGQTGSGSTTAAVKDAPLAALGSTLVITEGSPFTGVVATFTDLNPLSVAGDFTATIDWGDNTVSPGTIQADPRGGFDVIGTHNTFEEGAPLITVVINDKGGASTSAVTTANVIDAPLTGTKLAVSGTEATALTNAPVAAFTDGNPTAPVSDFTAMISWGDQTPATLGKVVQTGPGKFQVLGSHVYAQAGNYVITTVVLDKGGSNTQVASPASVAVLVVPVIGSLALTSDSGVSHTDGITNVAQPVFSGLAKPNTTVTLFAVRSGTTTGFMLGAALTDSRGNWTAMATSRLADGSYFVVATDTDSRGNVSGPNMLFPASSHGLLTIDTAGPKILGSTLNPRTGQVTIIFSDDRAGMSQPSILNKLNFNLATNTLVPRTIPLTNLSMMPVGALTDVVVGTFNGGAPLGVGSFVLTITALGVTDQAGNALVETHFVNFPQLGNSLPGNYIAEFDTNGQTSVGALQFVPLSAQTAADAYTQFLLNRLKIRITR